jgi:hypothetical protein
MVFLRVKQFLKVLAHISLKIAMASEKIDELDVNIIRALQKDAPQNC